MYGKLVILAMDDFLLSIWPEIWDLGILRQEIADTKLKLWNKWPEVLEMGHIGYKWFFMVHLTWNLGLRYIEAVDCEQNLGIVDQVTRSVENGTHRVWMTSNGAYDLKFGT
jgi:hypothetical protein